MEIAPRLVPGRFIKRDNRFLATVDAAGGQTRVHVRSSARMGELLVPGRLIFLAPSNTRGRKTNYTLVLVKFGEVMVSVDATLPNRLVSEVLSRGDLEPFAEYRLVEREKFYGNSRFDFRLSEPGVCLLEVKSVTLVRDRVAFFPDAPSERGRRHLEELAAAVKEGFRCAVIFVVQRHDGKSLAPNDEADPAFGAALRHAAEAGVEIYALSCSIEGRHIETRGWIPVNL